MNDVIDERRAVSGWTSHRAWVAARALDAVGVATLPAPGSRRTIVLVAATVVGLAAAVGILAAFRPGAAIGLIISLYVVAGFAIVAWRLRAPFSFASFVVIGGYICLTRGFAGVGLGFAGLPLLVGELALAGLAPLAVLRLGWRVPASILIPFAIWIGFNALLTARDFGTYRMDAVRDAAMWYYAGFVLIGAATWRELGTDGVRRWIALPFAGLLVTVPLVMAVGVDLIPPIEVPIADGPLLAERMDASAMHLIGGAALFLTGPGMRRPPWPGWLAIAIVTGLLAITAAIQVRAASVGLAGAFGVLMVYRLVRPVVAIGIAMGMVLAVLWVLDIEFPGGRGMISARSIVERQVSTLTFLGGSSTYAPDDEKGGTIEWRTIWWEALIEESLGNQTYLLIGRGFGADLREAVVHRAEGSLNWDQGLEEGKPVRSPHNIAMTVFARTGLVGLAAWLLVLATCFTWMIRATLERRRRGDRDEELFGVWLIIYVLTMLLVALFGVVLESPFGAAPFFWALGVGLAWSAASTT